MILDRYLTRQIARPFLMVCLVLIGVFAGYSAALFLGQAASGVLSSDVVASLIALKVAIALEVLLPFALYLTVVVGLGRMYGNNEMTAMRAIGVSQMRIVRIVLRVVLPVTLCVGSFSLVVRPWAYTQSYALRARAEGQIDSAQLKGDRFHHDIRDDWTLFASRVDEEGVMHGVFLALGARGQRRVFSAGSGHVKRDEADAGWVVTLGNVHAYDLSGSRLAESSYSNIELRFGQADTRSTGYKRKAASSIYLASSDSKRDLAELQWRLSRPLSAFLLGVLAVFLSRTDPRRGGYAKVFLAMGIYVAHYALSLVAKTWVDSGSVGALPGIWWVDALLGAVVLALLLHSASGAMAKKRGGA